MATFKNFKRIEYLKYGGKTIELLIDKNDSVHYCYFCNILSWKKDEKGKKIPNEIQRSFDSKLFEKIKGNPYQVAVDRAMTYIERMNF